MAVSFKDKLWSQYVIPQTVSCWYGDDVTTQAVSDLDVLIASCVDELRSDLYITDYMVLNSMTTHVDEDIFAVVNAKLTFPFQGNRSVRVELDRGAHQILCRYVPARVTYRRYLRLSDLDTLAGDQLVFALMYVLSKMAEKELAILRSVVLDADNGQVNLDALSDFASTCRSRYEELKESIFIYSSGI